MNMVITTRWHISVALLAIGLGDAFTVKSAETNVSRIIAYVYEQNPARIKAKMYNWEVKFTEADSRNGACEIVQMTKSKNADPKSPDTEAKVLVESKMIVRDQDGTIDFNFCVGDKEPTQNMGRRGNIGQPVIFSGVGTGVSTTNWIVLPGTKTDRVAPSAKGTQFVDGRVRLVQFVVTNDGGEKFQLDVILRRK